MIGYGFHRFGSVHFSEQIFPSKYDVDPTTTAELPNQNNFPCNARVDKKQTETTTPRNLATVTVIVVVRDPARSTREKMQNLHKTMAPTLTMTSGIDDCQLAASTAK